jgi:hypothetical protein
MSMINLKHISCNYVINFVDCDWLRNGAKQTACVSSPPFGDNDVKLLSRTKSTFQPARILFTPQPTATAYTRTQRILFSHAPLDAYCAPVVSYVQISGIFSPGHEHH